jgi:hypothetical protein
MRDRWKPVVAAALTVALAACSAGASAPTAGGVSPGQGGPGSAAGSPPAATSAGSPAEATPAETPAPSVGSVKEIDVCSKLSKAEVESAIGKKVKPAETMHLTTETAGCQWDAADNSLTFLQVYVAAYTQELWDIDLDKPGTETVPNVGDAAIRTEVGLMGPAGTLVIRKGALRIDLEIYTETGKKSAVAAQGIQLANLLLPRL